MPSLRLEGQLAAGATNGNLLADSRFVQMPFPAVITLYGCMDGPAVGTVICDLSMGQMIEVDGAAVYTYTASLGPDQDKHFLGKGVARAHDRLALKLVNGGAAAANYRFLIDIRPL